MTWKIYPLQHLREHRESWDNLVQNSCKLPFLETDFILPLLDHFSQGKELLAVDHAGPEWRIATIILPNRFGMWNTFQPSQLPLGAWIGPRESAKDGNWTSCIHDLLKILPNINLGLGLTQLDSLFHTIPKTSLRQHTQDYIDSAWIDVISTFEEYWNTRGKNIKQNIKKQQNKLSLANINLTHECITTPTEVENAIEIFCTLEQSGWKANQGTALARKTSQSAFYASMLENFCRKNEGRIYLLKLDSKIVAMDLCISNEKTLVILKTAYDESYKGISPSTLMRYEQMSCIFSEYAFNRIEFYGRLMEWHKRWTGNTRKIYHLNTYRWHWLKTLHIMIIKFRCLIYSLKNSNQYL